MLKGVESYKYLSELWAFLVLYAKSSRRDDCKMHILRSDAFLPNSIARNCFLHGGRNKIMHPPNLNLRKLVTGLYEVFSVVSMILSMMLPNGA